jgi:hypothetical protein
VDLVSHSKQYLVFGSSPFGKNQYYLVGPVDGVEERESVRKVAEALCAVAMVVVVVRGTAVERDEPRRAPAQIVPAAKENPRKETLKKKH